MVLWPLQILCEAQKGRRGIRLLSIGCGNGSVDAACLEQGWPINSFHPAEYDDHLLKVAASRLRTQGLAGSVGSHRFDFDSLAQLNLGSFDAIFFCYSLHHCADIEGLIHFCDVLFCPMASSLELIILVAPGYSLTLRHFPC